MKMTLNSFKKELIDSLKSERDSGEEYPLLYEIIYQLGANEEFKKLTDKFISKKIEKLSLDETVILHKYLQEEERYNSHFHKKVESCTTILPETKTTKVLFSDEKE